MMEIIEEHSIIVMDNVLYHSSVSVKMKKFPTIVGKKKIFNTGYTKEINCYISLNSKK